MTNLQKAKKQLSDILSIVQSDLMAFESSIASFTLCNRSEAFSKPKHLWAAFDDMPEATTAVYRIHSRSLSSHRWYSKTVSEFGVIVSDSSSDAESSDDESPVIPISEELKPLSSFPQNELLDVSHCNWLKS
jgi:hypothetical protein